MDMPSEKGLLVESSFRIFAVKSHCPRFKYWGCSEIASHSTGAW